MNNRGETLVEMTISLALFALTVTMLVTVFKSSSESLAGTMEAKQNICNQESAILLEDSLEKIDTRDIQYSYTVDGNNYTGSFSVDLCRTSEGVLYKFR